MRTTMAVVVAAMMLAVTLEAPALPAAGAAAPDFALKNAAGKNLRLSELRGEVVLLNFWATWCGPCRQELPHLDKIHGQYRNAGLTVLAINIDNDRANAEAMLQKLGVRVPTLYDADKRVSKLYEVDTMPLTVIIDRDGRVRYVHRGYRAGFEQKYEQQVRELLRQ
jgi:peroxiredoxin